MPRYIDADKLKEIVTENSLNPYERSHIHDLIDIQPTADVQEVKHGKWIKINGAVWFPYSCSVCGDEADTNEYQYCHNGHKMDL